MTTDHKLKVSRKGSKGRITPKLHTMKQVRHLEKVTKEYRARRKKIECALRPWGCGVWPNAALRAT